MKNQVRASSWAILLVLLSAVAAWFFFEFAILSDLLVDSDVIADSNNPSAPMYGPEMAQVFRPSKYLLFAAVAVFALGSLMAQKRLSAVQRGSTHRFEIARAGNEFANTAIIIALTIAAWAAIGVFMESFVEYSSADVSTGVRILNTYVPIILYTTLVVAVLLLAFVFRKHRPQSKKTDRDTEPELTADGPEPEHVQRNVGLSFAVPIVAVAIALIFGLIVFDVTQTAIQVWIWVIIQLCIGAGIVAGTLLGQRAIDALRGAKLRVTGAATGAKNLNFIFSIIFAAVLSFMSLIYGVAAIEQLRVSSSLSLSVYSDQNKEQPSPSDELALVGLNLIVNGADLERNSAVMLTLADSAAASSEQPETLVSDIADRDGNFWLEKSLSQSLEPGSYSLEVTAVSADGSQLTRKLPFTVTQQATSIWPSGTDTFAQDTSSMQVLPVSAVWVFSDLLPALLLLILAAMVVFLTLRIRNLPGAELRG